MDNERKVNQVFDSNPQENWLRGWPKKTDDGLCTNRY